MNRILVWKLAVRYLRGKRGANAVPILSRISMLAIAVGSGAMIVLFSVFNGFEGIVRDLYKAFYPEIKITAARGKFFAEDNAKLPQIKAMPGVQSVAPVIEDNVLISGNGEQIVVSLKGVTPVYFSVNSIKPYIIQGRDSVSTGPVPTAIVGEHIANQLGLDVNNVFNDLALYYPDASSGSAFNIQSSFQTLRLKPDGVFRVQDEFDGKYVLAGLAHAQQLFGEQGYLSSLELLLDPKTNPEKIQQQLKALLGSGFKVETRYEQNKTLYMVMRTEKWAVYAILLLVLLIASFNMIGALSLLVLEKQKDMAILQAMGAQPRDVRSIFITEGILWALTGGGIGLLLGGLICLGQQHFGWLKLGGSFIIDAYPVSLQWPDFLLIIITVIAVGFLAAWYPARRAVRAEAVSLRSD
jgi:lipoprotein-releasing system permease protein